MSRWGSSIMGEGGWSGDFRAEAQVKICVTSVGMQQRGCGGSHTNIRSIISPQVQVMPQTSVCSSDVYRLNNGTSANQVTETETCSSSFTGLLSTE